MKKELLLKYVKASQDQVRARDTSAPMATGACAGPRARAAPTTLPPQAHAAAATTLPPQAHRHARHTRCHPLQGFMVGQELHYGQGVSWPTIESRMDTVVEDVSVRDGVKFFRCGRQWHMT